MHVTPHWTFNTEAIPGSVPLLRPAAHRDAFMAGHFAYARHLKELLAGEPLPVYGTFIVRVPALNLALAVQPGLTLAEITARAQRAIREETGDRKFTVNPDWALAEFDQLRWATRLSTTGTHKGQTVNVLFGEVTAN